MASLSKIARWWNLIHSMKKSHDLACYSACSIPWMLFHGGHLSALTHLLRAASLLHNEIGLCWNTCSMTEAVSAFAFHRLQQRSFLIAWGGSYLDTLAQTLCWELLLQTIDYSLYSSRIYMWSFSKKTCEFFEWSFFSDVKCMLPSVFYNSIYGYLCVLFRALFWG